MAITISIATTTIATSTREIQATIAMTIVEKMITPIVAQIIALSRTILSMSNFSLRLWIDITKCCWNTLAEKNRG